MSIDSRASEDYGDGTRTTIFEEIRLSRYAPTPDSSPPPSCIIEEGRYRTTSSYSSYGRFREHVSLPREAAAAAGPRGG